MMKLAKPRAIKDGKIIWWADDPQVGASLVQRTGEYCDQDIIVETAIDRVAPPLSAAERPVWELDQRINDRGIMVDVELVSRALAVVEYAKSILDDEMNALTGGAVPKASQVAKLVKWINDQGVACESIAKGEQEELIASATGNAAVLRAIDIRKQAGLSSTSKLKTMLDCACDDDRARGQLFYYGASTGRWAGRLIQVQNLKRNDPEKDGPGIKLVVGFLLNFNTEAAYDLIGLCVGPVMEWIAKSIRAMFKAAKSKKFIGADLSNIEGRIGAWFPGEDWKLKAFAEYDAGLGPDLYCVAYAAAFGDDAAEVKKDKAKRQIGKVMELALGYQGSVGSFINMGAVYGLKPEALVEPIRKLTSEAEWEDTAALYAKASKYGLPQDQWTAIKLIVKQWRAAHPKLVQGWWDLQDAAIEAVLNPGQLLDVFDGRVKYTYIQKGKMLLCMLPSGRVLYYHNAAVVRESNKWVAPDGTEMEDSGQFSREQMEAAGWTWKRGRRRVDLDGYDGQSRKWTRFTLYGGMQFNHVVQGTARDKLVSGMLRCEAAGYPLVLTVHDENVAEVDDGFGSPEEMERLMIAEDSWLKGCPLAAKGWADDRYGK